MSHKHNWKFISHNAPYHLDGITNYERAKRISSNLVVEAGNNPSKQFINYYDNCWANGHNKYEDCSFFLGRLE